MNRIKNKIKTFIHDDLFVRNQEAAYKQDGVILHIILVAGMVCMIFLFGVSFVAAAYASMKWMYALMSAVLGVLLFLSVKLKGKAMLQLAYVSHIVFLLFCAYSSAYIYPDEIAIMVLSEMLMFPTLFIDKNARSIAVSAISSIGYLVIISFNKEPYCFSNEVVNVMCFTILGGIIGLFTRRAQLLYFDNMEQLRISREQYRIAIEHNKGIICEFNVKERCIIMKPDVAALFHAPLKVRGIPFEPIKIGSVKDESVNAYIEFFSAIINGKKSGTAELNLMTVRGWRWYKANFTTIFAENGTPISAVISFTDITEQHKKDEQAERDGLTGVYNRNTTQLFVDADLSKKADNRGAFILADLDDLKIINDTLGHPKGDYALRVVASAFNKLYGKIGIVGRIGGDEFAVYIPNAADRNALGQSIELVMKQIAAVNIGEQYDYRTSVSIGIVFCAQAEKSFEALYNCADKALYQAKNNGKNRFVFFG